MPPILRPVPLPAVVPVSTNTRTNLRHAGHVSSRLSSLGDILGRNGTDLCPLVADGGNCLVPGG